MVHRSFLGLNKPVRLKDLVDIKNITPMRAAVLVMKCDPGPSGTAVTRKPILFRLGPKPVLVTAARRDGDDHIRLVIVDQETGENLRSCVVECRSKYLPLWFVDDRSYTAS
jgi:hypothetical protein